MKLVEFQAQGINCRGCPPTPWERRKGKRSTSKAVRRQAKLWLKRDYETKPYPIFGFDWWG